MSRNVKIYYFLLYPLLTMYCTLSIEGTQRKRGETVMKRSLQHIDAYKEIKVGKRKKRRPFTFYINFKSLKIKLLAIFIILIVFPVFLVAYIAVSTSNSDLVSNAKMNLSNATAQTLNYYEITLKQIEQGYINQITFDPAATDYINGKSHNGSSSANAMKVIQNISANYPEVINSGAIIKSNGDALGYPAFLSKEMKLTQTKWFKTVSESEKGVWLNEHNEGLPSSYNKEYVLSYGKALKNYDSKGISGIILLDIKENAFQDILSSVHVGKNARSYVITDNHRIITGKTDKISKEDASLDSNTLLQKSLDYSKERETSVFVQKYKEENYIVSFTKSNTTGWIFVTAMPMSEIAAITKNIQIRVAFLGIILIVFSMLIGIRFSLSITRALQKLMDNMGTIEKGDLRVVIQSDRADEIGKLADGFSKMLSQIKNLVIQSKEAASQVNASSNKMLAISRESARASSQIAQAIEEVAAGSSRQALEVESSVENVVQLAAKINNAVESTKVMGSASEDVRSMTSNGIKTMDLLKKQAIETNRMTENVVMEMGKLNQYVKDIDNITAMLKTIAGQTNLLALNAAIEAARAGDSGKGFAVVAEEVRKLAEQSDSFTKDIQSLITKILGQTESSTDMVRRADLTIKEQSDMVGETTQVFSEINKATDLLTTNIGMMSGIVNDLDKFKEQVMSSMESISVVSEQTAASAEEVSASTQEQINSIDELDKTAKSLNALAQNLVSVMEQFKLDD